MCLIGGLKEDDQSLYEVGNHCLKVAAVVSQWVSKVDYTVKIKKK